MEETYKPIEGYSDYSVSKEGKVIHTKTLEEVEIMHHNCGYHQVRLAVNDVYKWFLVHRLVAMAYIQNPLNKRVVDHIDGNRTNNNVNNLRFSTHSENSFNRKLGKNNRSGFKGVDWNNYFDKWQSSITFNGKLIKLGFFANKEDAIIARVKKAQELFGIYINKCEIIKEKRAIINRELDEELEALEREFESLLLTNNHKLIKS